MNIPLTSAYCQLHEFYKKWADCEFPDGSDIHVTVGQAWNPPKSFLLTVSSAILFSAKWPVAFKVNRTIYCCNAGAIYPADHRELRKFGVRLGPPATWLRVVPETVTTQLSSPADNDAIALNLAVAIFGDTLRGAVPGDSSYFRVCSCADLYVDLCVALRVHSKRRMRKKRFKKLLRGIAKLSTTP